jgi:hypothetical protein
MVFDIVRLGLKAFVVVAALLAAVIGANYFEPKLLSSLEALPKRTIGVKGTAEVSALADRVEVSGAVTTAAKSAADALNENNVIMARILDGLKADGIGRDKIRTTGFSISPQHPAVGESSYNKNELVTTGYVVKNSINVLLPVNDYSGKLLDRIIRLGATNIDSITFMVTNYKEQEEAARALAVLDARKQGEIAAKALGMRLGRVVGIDRADLPFEIGDYSRDRDVRPPPPPPAAPAPPLQEVSIIAREQVFSAKVVVVFELD